MTVLFTELNRIIFPYIFYFSLEFTVNDRKIFYGLIPLTHSRRDLLNVLNFEYLQLGDFLGIMSVKEF